MTDRLRLPLTLPFPPGGRGWRSALTRSFGPGDTAPTGASGFPLPSGERVAAKHAG